MSLSSFRGKTCLAALALFLAAGAAAAVLLIWQPVGGEARPDEPYPFSATPELPRPVGADRDVLSRLAADFLQALEWATVTGATQEWSLVDVAVLTRKGERAGGYGDVVFRPAVWLESSLPVVSCREARVWEGSPFWLGGLQVWLLDGEDIPYHVLLWGADDEFPGQQDASVPSDC